MVRRLARRSVRVAYYLADSVGVAIGVNAAIISVVTEWLSDLKLGRCSNGWWLNRKFCCWEIEVEGSCDDWLPWTHWSIITYLAYVLLAMTFGGSAGYLVRSFAPFAAGSGISEIKCMLAGFLLDGYLGLSTLAIKSITLVRPHGESVALTGPAPRHRLRSVGRQGGAVSPCRLRHRQRGRAWLPALQSQ